MKSLITRVLTMSCLMAATGAFAQAVSPPVGDTSKTTENTQPAPQDTAPNPAATSTSRTHGMMRSCMKRHAAANDGSTKAQMHSACKAELKAAMDTDNSQAPK